MIASSNVVSEPASPSGPVSDVITLEACRLSNAIASREVSCCEVMQAYLDHIVRLNPMVNAIVSLREPEGLIAEARELDEELARGRYRGWMHGFPQAIKDLVPTKGIRTTRGSLLYKDHVPDFDAPLVRRVKEAGGIIIGKTNTSEFGLGSHTDNDVFGTTLNAYDPSRSAGGSSGGAAVAVALRMLPVADGSDHAGSLRNPAAFNNVFGFRPSFGRVPSDLVDVFMPSLSVHGPMARTIPDLAMLLRVQSGYDARVPLSIRQDPAIFSGSLERDFKGNRLAWLGDFGGYLPFEPGVLDLCKRSLKIFEQLGCIVEEARPDFPIEEVWRNWLKIRASQVGARFKEFYNDPAKRALMKAELQWEIETGTRLSADEISEAGAVRR